MGKIEKYLQYGVSNIEAQKLERLNLPLSTLKSTSQKNLIEKYGLSEVEAKRIKQLVSRQPIRQEIIQALLINSSFMCCCCKTPEYGFIIHHIEEYSISQDNSYENLVVICLHHHDQAHKKSGLTFSLTATDLKAAKIAWENDVVNYKNKALKERSLDTDFQIIDADNVKFSENSDFKVLVLPFEELEGEPTNNIEKTLKRRLMQKSEEEELDLEIKYAENIYSPDSYHEANSIGKALKADLVIWGEKYSKTSQGEILYVITRNEEVHIERNRKSGIGLIHSMSDIKNGKLQKDLDFVIYWIILTKEFNNGNDEKLVGTAKKIIHELKIEDINTYNIYGQGLYRLNRFEEAIEAFEKCIEIGGGGEVVFNNLGLSYFEINELNKAEYCYNKSFMLAPFSPIINHNLGSLELQKGNFILGRAYIKISLNIDESSSSAWNALGQSFCLTKDFEEAKEALQIGLEIDSGNPFLNDTMGILLHEIGQFEEAEYHLELAVSNKPDFAKSYNTLGLVKKELGKKEEALMNFLKAIEIKPSYNSPYFNLIHFLYNNNQYESLVALYENSPKSIIFSSDVEVEIGDSYFYLGEFDKALSIYEKLPVELGTDWITKYNTAIIYFEKSKNQQALEKFLSLKDEDDLHPGVYYYLGLIHLRISDLETCITYLNKSFNLDSDTPFIWLAFAKYWKEMNNHSMAKECYQKAIKIDSKSDTEMNNRLYLE